MLSESPAPAAEGAPPRREASQTLTAASRPPEQNTPGLGRAEEKSGVGKVSGDGGCGWHRHFPALGVSAAAARVRRGRARKRAAA